MDEMVLAKRKGKCAFCKTSKCNPTKNGPIYTLGRITVHYYCVLLSNDMQQNGQDNEGIFGFLLEDIKNVLNNTKNCICYYCKKKNASLKCIKCPKKFHFYCGIKNDSLSQFFGKFNNYCSKHRPKQCIPKKYILSLQQNSTLCSICYEKLKFPKLNKILWAPCCKKTWYHKNCVQKLANSAGYLFRCATCNDEGTFKKWVQQHGIFIPQKDASWELVPNAFEELLFRHGTCNADYCKCPEGREKDLENSMWEIVLCQSCGSQGIHVACGQLKFTNPKWECTSCSKIVGKDCTDENDQRDDELIKATPGTSKRKINCTMHENINKKKLKLCEYETNDVLDKRKKNGTSTTTDEIIDIETVDPLQHQTIVTSTKYCSEKYSPNHSHLRDDQDYCKKNSDNSELDKEAATTTKFINEIVIDSSDTECEEILVTSDSDDEIEIISVVKKGWDKTVIELSDSDVEQFDIISPPRKRKQTNKDKLLKKRRNESHLQDTKFKMLKSSYKPENQLCVESNNNKKFMNQICSTL